MKSADRRFSFILKDCNKFWMGIEIFSQFANSGIFKSLYRVHGNSHDLRDFLVFVS